MPVIIERSGKCPCRTIRRRPSAIGVASEKLCHLGLDCLREQGTRALTQDVGERIGKGPWLGKLENVSLSHGVSLLQGRSGGSNTPTIRRLTLSRRHQLPRIAPWRARHGLPYQLIEVTAIG